MSRKNITSGSDSGRPIPTDRLLTEAEVQDIDQALAWRRTYAAEWARQHDLHKAELSRIRRRRAVPSKKYAEALTALIREWRGAMRERFRSGVAA